jgi:transcriptional regulator
MYVPQHNQVTDHAKRLDFMRAHSFAAVISHASSGLRATHVPVLIEEVEDRIRILFHMAKANPQGMDLAQGQEAMMIYAGPHAYISPRLYERTESVPTWNYAAVHAYGIPSILENPEDKLGLLEKLINLLDPDYLVKFRSLRQEYVNQRLGAIVAFSFQVTRLQARFKLSQDRSKTERERIIATLEGADDGAAVETAQLMREWLTTT